MKSKFISSQDISAYMATKKKKENTKVLMIRLERSTMVTLYADVFYNTTIMI